MAGAAGCTAGVGGGGASDGAVDGVVMVTGAAGVMLKCVSKTGTVGNACYSLVKY